MFYCEVRMNHVAVSMLTTFAPMLMVSLEWMIVSIACFPKIYFMCNILGRMYLLFKLETCASPGLSKWSSSSLPLNFFKDNFLYWLVLMVLIWCRYLEPLAIALDHEKWSLVQILLSSSYTAYGTSSLEQVCAYFISFFIFILPNCNFF